MKTRWSTYEILILSAILTFVALAMFAQPLVPNGPQCTQQGWYKRNCDQSWVFINPGMAGHIIPSGCAAHTELVYGSDGAQYALIDQCPIANPCTGTQGLYKRPSDDVAYQRWRYYFDDPDALLHRTQHGYHGPGVPPAGLQTYSFIFLSQMPDPPRQTFINSYQCNVTPTPTVPPLPTPTPAPSIYGRYITWAYDHGVIVGCGNGMFCPGEPVNGLVTRAQLCVYTFNAFKIDHPNEPLPACRPIFSDVVCGP